MKKVKTLISYLIMVVFFLLKTMTFAQCVDETHTTNISDSWVSCQKDLNPNSARENSHWVQYDLGYLYKVDSMKIWNYNVSGETNKGMKNIVIDYSIDGINWTEATTSFLMEASGNDNYIGENMIDIGTVDTRYILLTANDTWGADCAGISEVRLSIAGTVSGLNDVYANEAEITLFPNPTEDIFVIEGILKDYKISILSAQGYLLKQFNSLHNQVIIDISDLPPGMIFVRIENENNQNLFLQKIIKI